MGVADTRHRRGRVFDFLNHAVTATENDNEPN